MTFLIHLWHNRVTRCGSASHSKQMDAHSDGRYRDTSIHRRMKRTPSTKPWIHRNSKQKAALFSNWNARIQPTKRSEKTAPTAIGRPLLLTIPYVRAYSFAAFIQYCVGKIVSRGNIQIKLILSGVRTERGDRRPFETNLGVSGKLVPCCVVCGPFTIQQQSALVSIRKRESEQCCAVYCALDFDTSDDLRVKVPSEL